MSDSVTKDVNRTKKTIHTKLQVLRANQNKDGYVNTSWTSETNSRLTKNSNITNDNDGTIFQDQFKNLWTTGNGTSLQVLEVNSSRNRFDQSTIWTSIDDSRLTKILNIADGWSKNIFQDEFKNHLYKTSSS